MSAGETDPVMKQLREQISDLDRSVIDAINRRLKLVAQLKR
jgi:chorismate mutase